MPNFLQMVEELKTKKPKSTLTQVKPRRERREESRNLANRQKKADYSSH
jgi:hypothetical protein